MGKSHDLNCACGRMTLTVNNTSAGRHIKCYCKSCQAAVRHLGKGETYLENGGTHIFHTVPHNISITAGQHHLALMRLSPKGTYRWYASCCNTPIATTLSRRNIPFVGVTLRPHDPAFGKVASHVNTKTTQPPIQPTGITGLLVSAMAGVISTWATGKGKITPFFDAQGTAIVEPRVLTKPERDAAFR